MTEPGRDQVSVRREVAPEKAEEAAAPGYEAVSKSGPGQRGQIPEEQPATAHLAQHMGYRGGAPMAPARRRDQPDPAVDIVTAQPEPLDETRLLVGDRRHTAGRGALGYEARAAGSKASGPVEDEQDWLSIHRVQP